MYPSNADMTDEERVAFHEEGERAARLFTLFMQGHTGVMEQREAAELSNPEIQEVGIEDFRALALLVQTMDMHALTLHMLAHAAIDEGYFEPGTTCKEAVHTLLPELLKQWHSENEENR